MPIHCPAATEADKRTANAFSVVSTMQNPRVSAPQRTNMEVRAVVLLASSCTVLLATDMHSCTPEISARRPSNLRKHRPRRLGCDGCAGTKFYFDGDSEGCCSCGRTIRCSPVSNCASSWCPSSVHTPGCAPVRAVIVYWAVHKGNHEGSHCKRRALSRIKSCTCCCRTGNQHTYSDLGTFLCRVCFVVLRL
jgi:hypothetical protein